MKASKALVGVAIALLCVPWSAFVLTKLWGWFVVPFHVQALGLWQAAGVTLVCRYIVIPEDMAKRKDDEPWKAVVLAVVYPAMVLGIGALYHRWAS